MESGIDRSDILKVAKLYRAAYQGAKGSSDSKLLL